MKPPLVSRAVFTTASREAQLAHLRGQLDRHDAMLRQPLGIQPNALPTYYLVAPPEGGLRLMWDRSKHGATGPQVCLATISAETLEALLASKSPVELKP